MDGKQDTEKQFNLLVIPAFARIQETYFVFRPDGTEAEVVFKDDRIILENPELTEYEREYFTSGEYKFLKGQF